MRRDMRKPPEMKVRQYYQALTRINGSELLNLPPFNPNQNLSDDEMIDVLLFGTPKSWQAEMDRQGFDPVLSAPSAVVEFMENIEAAEAATFKPTEKKLKTSGKGKKGHDKSYDKSEKKPTNYCKHHGYNWTHDTENCKVLKNKAGSGGSKNKSWTRKADESKFSSKKELAALINKTVDKKVKKQLAAVGKKRKTADSDTEEDGECFLLQELTKDLDGFNYEDMEKLSLDDGSVTDKVSV